MFTGFRTLCAVILAGGLFLGTAQSAMADRDDHHHGHGWSYNDHHRHGGFAFGWTRPHDRYYVHRDYSYRPYNYGYQPYTYGYAVPEYTYPAPVYPTPYYGYYGYHDDDDYGW